MATPTRSFTAHVTADVDFTLTGDVLARVLDASKEDLAKFVFDLVVNEYPVAAIPGYAPTDLAMPDTFDSRTQISAAVTFPDGRLIDHMRVNIVIHNT